MDALLFQLRFLSHFFFHHVMPIRRVNDGPTHTHAHTPVVSILSVEISTPICQIEFFSLVPPPPFPSALCQTQARVCTAVCA